MPSFCCISCREEYGGSATPAAAEAEAAEDAAAGPDVEVDAPVAEVG